MGNWRPLPAIYFNQTLSDEELQTVMVREAEAKYLECVADRERLEDDIRAAKARLQGLRTAEAWAAARDEAGELADGLDESLRVEAAAKTFLNDARAALEQYRTPPPARKVLRGRRRALKRPGRGGG